MITKLKSDIKSVKNILHIADIHIMLNSRFDEYNEIFQKVYSFIKTTPADTLTCLCGDLLHNKLVISPESLQFAADFLFTCANIRPTILIAGNHDLLTKNLNRLDSLSPIVSTLNHPNLFYLKNSGLYGIGDVLFSVCSVIDPDNFVKYDKIPKIYKNEYKHHIALYHGVVDGVLSDNGRVLTNERIKTTTFDGYHFCFLGDIHLSQTLQEYNYDNSKPIIRYCGSLVSRTFAEENYNNGVSLWDLDKKTYKHIEIPNDYGFFTVEINKGKLITDLTKIPKKATIRINCIESLPTEVKAVVKQLKEKTEVKNITYKRIVSDDNNNNNNTGINVKISDISDVNYQNQLITDFLKNNCKIINQSIIDSVIELNKQSNSKINKDKLAKNVKWLPKKLEFSNMFSYGENNTIDFTKMNGIVGIFGQNRIGKTSLSDSLCYCLFDKTVKSHKTNNILNNQKNSFKCKLNFEIDGIDYFIERIGVADKKGRIKVDVSFWKEKNGIKTNLEEEERRSTNDVIRDYIGNFEDFLLTTLSVQNSKDVSSFIDMTQGERKDLLSQFIGLEIFDKLLESVKDEFNELESTLKIYKKDDTEVKLSTFNNELISLTSAFNDENSQLEALKEEKNGLNNNILEETKKLKHIDGKVIDIKYINSSLYTTKEDLNRHESNKNSIKSDIEKLDKELAILTLEITNLESKDVKSNYSLYINKKSELDHINNQLNLKLSDVTNKKGKLEMLKKHEYDPNCKYCVNNPFVLDAKKIAGDLDKEKIVVKKMISEKDILQSEVNSLEWSVDANTDYSDLISTKTNLKDKRHRLISSFNSIEGGIIRLETDIKELNKEIENYNNNIENIEFNKTLQKSIDIFNQNLNNLDFSINQKNKSLMEKNGRLTVLKNNIESLEDNIKKIKELEKKYEIYSLYTKSVNRDGLPLVIITNILPKIEEEVNNILDQITDFKVKLETDGKNVNIFIDEDDKKWAAEMSSGFEKFVISLAMRVALTNISNCPRTNMLVLDEGFSVIDSVNMASVQPLLSFLKTYFEYIIVISHLDTIKDVADDTIEITKENGFSKVNYI